MATKSTRPSAQKSKAQKRDAIALLKADHRQVAEWFTQELQRESKAA